MGGGQCTKDVPPHLNRKVQSYHVASMSEIRWEGYGKEQSPGRKEREGKQGPLDFHYFLATMGFELPQLFPLTAQRTHSAMIQVSLKPYKNQTPVVTRCHFLS